ncbi:MAG TPA: DNA ligase [Firmicutes bacterium]|nr:DNA ligase [Bacillota bacterium]
MPVELTALWDFFTALQPMEPLSKKEPFNSPDYIFQVKWDGVRILAMLEQRRVTLKNRRGNPRTGQYPELQKLVGLVEAGSAVFDGEVVALMEGKPSLSRVLQRDSSRRESVTGALQRQIPCTYCLFDLLYLDGTDLTDSPIERRQQLLAKVVRSAPPLYLCDSFHEGIALYREIERAELEGIVAKKKGSLYWSGKSADWLKIKPRRRQLCVVGGLNMAGGAVGSLLLGAYRGGELLYIGKAGSGLKRDDLLLLRDYALQDGSPGPHFRNPPRGRGLLWLEPRLTVEIEFLEWTGDLRLRAPVVVGFSDRLPAEAVI